MIVVDASVAVKWLLPEQGHEQASALLREEYPLYAPAWIRVEVANAVLKRFRDNTLSESTARRVCDTWSQMLEEGRVRLIPTEDLFASALQLGFAARHPLADCLYLAAAKRLDAMIVTADRTLHQRGKAVHPHITLLAPAA